MPKCKLTTVEHVCETCNSSFFPSLSNFTKGKCRFCCRKCYIDRQRDTIEDRFWKYVGGYDKNGCLIWNGTTNGVGYGVVWVQPHPRVLAHRVAYSIANGPIRDGILICHRCDNPACVNHEHLFAGTHRQNMDDMLSKGRDAKGEQMPQSKLKEADIIAIRLDHDSGTRHSVIARKYGVTHTSITNVVRRVTWKHVP